MKIHTFNEFCPYEIGDKVRVAGNDGYSVITDIAFVYYAKTKKTEYRVEFDDSGVYKLVGKEEEK